MAERMPRKNCQNPDRCLAAGRGGPCRPCDAQAIAQRAVTLRERIALNLAEGRPPYAERFDSIQHEVEGATPGNGGSS